MNLKVLFVLQKFLEEKVFTYFVRYKKSVLKPKTIFFVKLELRFWVFQNQVLETLVTMPVEDGEGILIQKRREALTLHCT